MKRRTKVIAGIVLAVIVSLVRTLVGAEERPDRTLRDDNSVHNAGKSIRTYTKEILYNESQILDFGTDFLLGKTCSKVWGDNAIQGQTESTLVQLKLSCQEAFNEPTYGTGNYISAIYGLRMAAYVMGETDVSLECSDANQTKASLILPWLMGSFPREEGIPPEHPSVYEVCPKYRKVQLGYRWRDMQFDLRRLAVALVGIPSPHHPSAQWAKVSLWSVNDPYSAGRNRMQLPHPQEDAEPLFPKTELDDAVLHLRCGDIIDSDHASFGFMRFSSYSRHISPTVKSIGIVTQPFDAKAQQREKESDKQTRERCKMVVFAFQRHLDKKFPEARVSVRNDVDETIALTYARMIMANQTIVGISTFGVFPAIASFGTGYIRYPNFVKAPNRWLTKESVVSQIEGIRLITEPRLAAKQVKERWGDDGTAVLRWLEGS